MRQSNFLRVEQIVAPISRWEEYHMPIESDDDYLETLKEKINEFLYLNLHENTTIKEMEELACDIHLRMETIHREKQMKFTITTTEGKPNDYQSATAP